MIARSSSVPIDDAVGPHEIVDRGAFLQEFRIGDHGEGNRRAAPLKSSSAIAARTRSAVPTGTVDLSTTTLNSFIRLPMLARGRQHVLHVGRAVLVGRRADGDELQRAVRDAGVDVGGEAKAPGRRRCGG